MNASMLRFVAGVVWAAGCVVQLAAQNLLPNPGFEEGASGPAGWQLVDGAGEWASPGHSGGRLVAVRGNGDDQSVWRTGNLRLVPGALYRLSFQARRLAGATGGTAVAGPSRVNRDFPLDGEWRAYGFVFAVPEDGASDYLRLGQWHVNGTVEFDDVELNRVRVGESAALGVDERIEEGVYRFEGRFSGPAGNWHRTLWRNRASFNSDRWVLSPGSEVVYRFDARLAAGAPTQTNAHLRVSLNHYTAGRLEVEASPDASRWHRVGALDEAVRTLDVDLPAGLFPATNTYVRLRFASAEGAMQVGGLDFTAGLAGMSAGTRVVGRSDFLDVAAQATGWDVCVRSAGSRGGSEVGVAFVLTNATGGPAVVSARVSAGREGTPQRGTVPPGGCATFSPGVRVDEPGEHVATLTVTEEGGRVLVAGRTVAQVSFLEDPRAGRWLADSPAGVCWWCEGGWKIGQGCRAPERPEGGAVGAVRVSAAGGEYEAAQLVISPREDGQLRAVRTGLFRNGQGVVAPITVRVDDVTYVEVTLPTDGRCTTGAYPDPLPPLALPRGLARKVNVPLWLTFHVPAGTPAGDYRSECSLETDRGTLSVPIEVHVYGFDLPRDTHLHSALGLGTGAIDRYHRLTNHADRVAVFEKYLQNFAEHRISPYSFFDYASIDVRFVGEGTNRQARVDFTEFDRAAQRWLDQARFSTFQLPLQGMGGGTFHERYPGELAGFKEGTPEHTRLFADYLGQIERHLRERGWLGKAFTYWFDEPDKKDYAFVVEGMKRLKSAAPGLQRMLTEQPEPELMGHVDIWCGLTPEWTPERVRARQEAGEQVWWYICCAPKAPYVTEFIDHPGTELRLWPWQSWQYGVTGILVWATTWWTSPTAYPDRLQDPWRDPMSWVSGYGTPIGTRSPWGNGDGRFLYPPRRDPNGAGGPSLEGPINSIRWENLRDGLEDYEYFWLLDREVRRLAGVAGQEGLVGEARGLLRVPDAVSRDLTHFTTDPRVLLAHRDAMGRMIERLVGHR
jgi:hypothetical protein